MRDFLGRRSAFAGEARLSVYRFEVTADGVLDVAQLHVDTVDQTRRRERLRGQQPERGNAPR